MSTTTNPYGARPLNVIFEDVRLTEREIFPFAVENVAITSDACKLFNQVAGTESRSGNVKVEVYRYGTKYPYATIAPSGRTASGSNLILNFVDNQYEGFRVGSILRPANQTNPVLGQVISSAAGTVTIKPFGASAFGSSDFLASEVAGYEGIITELNGGDSVERMEWIPYDDYNYIEQRRETAYLYASERWQATKIKAGNGEFYYALQSQMQAMEDLMKPVCKSIYTGTRTKQGDYYMAGGLPWQIQNQGGTYQPFYSSLSESEYQSVIAAMIKKGGLKSQKLLQIWGTGYGTMFGNNVGKQYVTTAGTNNVLGGTSVFGLNIKDYGWGDYTIAGMKDAYLDSPGVFEEEGTSTVNGFRKRSNFSIIMDPSMAKTDGGFKPFVMQYYFGAAPMIRAKRAGLTDMNGMPASNPTSGKLVGIEDYHYSGMYQLTQPSAHGVHFLTV